MWVVYLLCLLPTSWATEEKFPSFPYAPRPLVVLWAAARLSCRGEGLGYPRRHFLSLSFSLKNDGEGPSRASPSTNKQTNKHSLNVGDVLLNNRANRQNINCLFAGYTPLLFFGLHCLFKLGVTFSQNLRGNYQNVFVFMLKTRRNICQWFKKNKNGKKNKR